MTIKTPTADMPVEGLSQPDGLPDEAEISRWASAFFKQLPGANDGPPFPAATPTAVAAPGGALPPLGVSGFGPVPTASGPSLGGIGLTPAMPSSGAVQPPLPSSFEVPPPAAPVSSAPFQPETPTASSDLYILAEAQSRGTGSPAAPPEADWLTPRSNAMPVAFEIPTLQPSPVAPGRDGPSDTDPLQFNGGYPAFDVAAVRRDFPILRERINGRPLIWFDNGATTQKPQQVIDRLSYFYEHENSNVHRAAHTLAARATDAYENARKIAARFLGASGSDEIVFVRGATEAINLVAQSWGRQNIGAGDEIVISHLEHHANIVPWQQLAAEKGARLRVIPVDDQGQILLAEYEKLLSDKTRIVAVAHVSNVLGTVVPIADIIARAHAVGAKVLIDGAQSVAHARANVQALDADFFVFSGHKILGPTGIGVLYGKRDILNAMPPWQGGGNMIADVTFEKTLYNLGPARFEAGTGNLADAVGLGAALEYVERIGLENIARHEHDLLDYATMGVRTIPGLRIFGTTPDKVSVLSFLIDGHSPEEIGKALDRHGIAVRSGHHCAQPILRRFGVEGTVRASFALYNTREEIDCFIVALRQIVRA